MQDIIDVPGQATLSAADYANKYGISRRTVSRYIKQGKLEAVKHTGRTYILDRAPAAAPVRPEPEKRPDSQDADLSRKSPPSAPGRVIFPPGKDAEAGCSQAGELRLPASDINCVSGENSQRKGTLEVRAATPTGPKPRPLAKHQANYVYRLGQLSEQAKSASYWKYLAIGLMIMAFIAAPGSVWVYSRWKDVTNALKTSQENTGRIKTDLENANTVIERLQADLLQSTTTKTQLAGDAATAQSLKEVNQRLLETLGRTTQQLKEERNRTAELEAKVSQLSYFLGQTEVESSTVAAPEAKDGQLRIIAPSEQFRKPN